MTTDEQIIKAALEIAAATCEQSAYAADADGRHFAYSIRAIDPAEVLAKVGAADTGGWNAVKTVHMTYRNYRGEIGRRKIVPARLWFGTTEWHPEPGWLLTAHDLGKGVERDFALADCEFAALTVTPQPDAVARLVETQNREAQG